MSDHGPQPTLTDGVVVLRPWRDEDVAPAVAGHDEEIARWFGWPVGAVTHERHRQSVEDWRAAYDAGRSRVGFVVEHDGAVVGSVEVRRVADGVGALSWALYAGARGQGFATRAVRLLVDYAVDALGLQRVEAEVDPRNERSLRVATRAGLRREGVKRVAPGMADRADSTAVVVLARLATDPPSTEPTGFRALLNSFLPRKRAIAQMLVRDPDGRVLLCRLTYKNDWDLPGGVVEVSESPAGGGLPRGRGGARSPGQGRSPPADRLAAAVGRLGRRALPRVRRRAWPTPRSSTTRSTSPARSGPRSSARSRRSVRSAPTSPPVGSRLPCAPSTVAARRTPSPGGPDPGRHPAVGARSAGVPEVDLDDGVGGVDLDLRVVRRRRCLRDDPAR